MLAIVKKLIIVFVLVLPATLSSATEPAGADQYFHKGSNHYIAKESEAAQEAVGEGLQADPNDAKLQALKKLLEQQQKQKQKEKDKQKQKEQQKKQQQDQKNKQKQDQNQEQKSDQQKKQDQQQQKQQKQQPQESEQQQKPKPKPEEMTEQEAQMLLDAMKQDEKAKREKMRIMMGKPQHVEKNW